MHAALMTDDTFGKLCALLAAFCWACAVPVLQRGAKELHPIAACAIRNACGVFWLLVFLIPQDVPIRTAAESLTVQQAALFLVSGVIGISLADTLFFLGARHLQVGVIGLTQTIYSPLVVFISCLVLHERMTPTQVMGAGMVVTSTILLKLAVITDDSRTKNDSIGFFCMIGCVLANVASILLLKVSVGAFPVPLLMPARNFIGLVPLLLWIAFQRPDSAVRLQFGSLQSWRGLLLGALLGSALSSTLWVLGFAHTKASIAALLNESSAIFMLLIGYMFLGERLGRRQLAIAALAAAGLCLLWL